MGFHEVRFPVALSFGSAGGPERRTEIVALTNGFEERNSPWEHSRRRYDAGIGLRSLADLRAVIAFFEARRGQLFAFRWKDWADWTSGQGEVPTAEFRVEPPADERDRVQLDRAELIRAASLSGGQYRSILDADALLDDLPPARKIPLDTDPPIPLWNDWRLLSLFLGLLTTEWVLRKRKQMV